MITNSQRAIAVWFIAATITVVAFQNCAQIPEPMHSGTLTLPSEDSNADLGNPAKISLIAPTNFVADGQDVAITVEFANVRDVSLSCRDKVTGEMILGQLVPVSGDEVLLRMDRDIVCISRGIAVYDRRPVEASSLFQVNCAPRVKNVSANRCE